MFPRPVKDTHHAGGPNYMNKCLRLRSAKVDVNAPVDKNCYVQVWDGKFAWVSHDEVIVTLNNKQCEFREAYAATGYIIDQTVDALGNTFQERHEGVVSVIYRGTEEDIKWKT
jgi:hypothetical protein